TALGAEYRSGAGLAQRDADTAAEPRQRVAEPDRRRGLAFAGSGRVDRRHQDELALGLGRDAVHEIEGELGLVRPVPVERLFRNAQLGADALDRLERGGARD